MKIKQCLLIDDDLDDHEIFSMAIKEIDPAIVCFFANDCDDGIEKLSRSTLFVPDYIFIDLNMPRINGIECLRQIKELSHLTHSEIIIYSTSIDEKSRTESSFLGATTFLVKPVGLDKLKTELQAILNAESFSNEDQLTKGS